MAPLLASCKTLGKRQAQSKPAVCRLAQHHIRIYSSKHRPTIRVKAVATLPSKLIDGDRDFLAPAGASDDGDDRPITEPFGIAPPGRFDQFAFREASAPPRSPRPEAVPESVGAML